MKLKNIISIVTVSGLLMFLPSCTDLEETLYSDLSESNISYTDEEIESMSGPVYTNLRYTYWAWEGLYDQCEESGDLIMTPLRPGVGWGAQYILMHKHTYNASIGHFYQTWYYPYVGIGYCNKLLDLEGIKADKEKVAEFRAMRALYYYILLDFFRNVPLITTSEIPAGFLPEQEDPAVVFDYIVAELEARSIDPGAYVLMLDIDGRLSECSSQNFFIVRQGKLFTPKRDNILEGIARKDVIELAKELKIECIETDLYTYDLQIADEIFVTANSICMVPVSKINCRHIGRPVPGPITKKLLSAWSEKVDVDIVGLALSHAND